MVRSTRATPVNVLGGENTFFEKDVSYRGLIRILSGLDPSYSFKEFPQNLVRAGECGEYPYLSALEERLQESRPIDQYELVQLEKVITMASHLTTYVENNMITPAIAETAHVLAWASLLIGKRQLKDLPAKDGDLPSGISVGLGLRRSAVRSLSLRRQEAADPAYNLMLDFSLGTMLDHLGEDYFLLGEACIRKFHGINLIPECDDHLMYGFSESLDERVMTARQLYQQAAFAKQQACHHYSRCLDVFWESPLKILDFNKILLEQKVTLKKAMEFAILSSNLDLIEQIYQERHACMQNTDFNIVADYVGDLARYTLRRSGSLMLTKETMLWCIDRFLEAADMERDMQVYMNSGFFRRRAGNICENLASGETDLLEQASLLGEAQHHYQQAVIDFARGGYGGRERAEELSPQIIAIRGFFSENAQAIASASQAYIHQKG